MSNCILCYPNKDEKEKKERKKKNGQVSVKPQSATNSLDVTDPYVVPGPLRTLGGGVGWPIPPRSWASLGSIAKKRWAGCNLGWAIGELCRPLRLLSQMQVSCRMPYAKALLTLASHCSQTPVISFSTIRVIRAQRVYVSAFENGK